MDRECRVSVEELEHDRRSRYWELWEREQEIARLMTDPEALAEYLTLTPELIQGIASFCLNESRDVGGESRSLLREVERQADNHLQGS